MTLKKVTALLLFTATFSVQANSNINIDALVEKCAPKYFSAIIKGMAKAESSLNPNAININSAKLDEQPTTRERAESLAKMLFDSDLNFDLGLMQINSQHFLKGRIFEKVGYKIEDALDPCTNISMSVLLLQDAEKRTGDIIKALSVYNTGHTEKGLKNGYVKKIVRLSTNSD